MAQIEILKMFREIEANRYDKDTIVREAYKILRMLKSIDAITRISYPTLSCQTLNLMTDVKVIIGLTTIQNLKDQRMVIHDRRICSAEQEVFNSGATVSRKYVHDEEEYEEEAIRVINAAKTASTFPDVENSDNQDLYEEMHDELPSRISTQTIFTENDYMDTPFHGTPPSSYNRRNNNVSNRSEVRALCVRIASARNNNEDTSAEELYKQIQLQKYSRSYDPDDDDALYYQGSDDTFSSTPMDDEYTQRRMGMMRQMSA
jgi:hypothetical protein